MPTYPRVPTTNNRQHTLDAQISASATTITLNESVAGVVRAPGYIVIDRIDSSGNITASKREYKYFTGVSGAQLSGVTSVDGTDQVHAVGAIVEFVPTVNHENDKYDVFTTEHSALGQHTSLLSLTTVKTGTLMGLSQASLNLLSITTHLQASGASLSGFPIFPAWVLAGTVSAATTAIGKPLSMPKTGNLQWASVTLRSPISAASLIIDINKNFTSIFEAGTRLSILGGGTFASTASINTKAFTQGNVFSVDVDAGGWFADATVQLEGR